MIAVSLGPVFVFAICSTPFLPETFGKPLPDSKRKCRKEFYTSMNGSETFPFLRNFRVWLPMIAAFDR